MLKNEPFKYIGDDYFDLHDSLNKMNNMEQVVFNISNGGVLISNREMQYMMGGDKALRASVEFLMAINRVLNTDPEKYKRIWSCQDPRYPQARRLPIALNGLVDEKTPTKNTSYIN